MRTSISSVFNSFLEISNQVVSLSSRRKMFHNKMGMNIEKDALQTLAHFSSLACEWRGAFKRCWDEYNGCMGLVASAQKTFLAILGCKAYRTSQIKNNILNCTKKHTDNQCNNCKAGILQYMATLIHQFAFCFHADVKGNCFKVVKDSSESSQIYCSNSFSRLLEEMKREACLQ